MTFNQFEKINTNLYKFDGMYYRLFAKGITPNGCWLFGSEMCRLIDIDATSGNDVFDKESIQFNDYAGGIIASGNKFIKY